MSSETFVLRIPFSRLLIGLALTLIPLSIAGLYSITQSDRSLEKTIGTHFKTIAETIAADIAQYIHDRVVDVGQMANDPTIGAAVAAANRSYQGMNDTAISAKFERLDKIWNTPQADPVVKQIHSSPASRLLRRHRDLDLRFLRITVTDERGATVAATHKTQDYFQADEEYWQNIYAQGTGAISVTDVLYDEVTKSSYIGVGVPILEEGSNRFIGTVDALVDISTVFPIVSRAQIGPTGRSILVKDDGTVISAPQMTLAMKQKSLEFRAALETMNSVGRETGYVVADVPGAGRNLIAFADTGLKRDYRNLSWLVLVCQNAREAFTPVRLVGRLMASVSVLGVALLTLLSVYFALHRRERLAEIGELPGEVAVPGATQAAVEAGPDRKAVGGGS
jgi:hypothetical protein